MPMLTVLWISRHQMTYDQQVDLQQILDETCKLVQYDKTVISLSQILPQLRQADVICAVLPPAGNDPDFFFLCIYGSQSTCSRR